MISIIQIIKEKKKLITSLLIVISIINLNFVVFAADKKKTDLEIKLEQQEQQMKSDIGNGIVPKDDDFLDNALDAVQNAEYKGFDIKKKTNSIINFINTFVVKSRSVVIITYGVLIIIISIYMATIGSRSINKRRNGMLIMLGNTILFLVFINMPLFIIYFTIAKNNIGEGISIYSRILNILEFFRDNSFIISMLLAYLGVSKLIISKNNLPIRHQGKYLLKASVILLIVLNLVPIAIKFII
ncbi:hypothetical protein FDB50_16990 [Clostridium botulinum]|uniref:Uncharacterized protein n=1 Tax=Clostridium botulinum TaxID=1491 RepID=A0A846K0V2_CLOBO|nr:hypothetical protein [Clostridium botulinum]NFN36741.1 hypothetical protein [Clostridium botulinum]